ncbi:hypothetical protein GO755_33255 [Spirosoma sp. HMF4905]|uniref:Fibronectin type-III domain-containing protein n=1 Tax=Spirosoma arboris TaxID=2682092 RepID=A0A7K1SMC8_9BACT|nr:fibronectin type III domain-containing protein [Spirosoma arboris]MVM34944.1 hypothetical protein [Spirosoma arboris]
MQKRIRFALRCLFFLAFLCPVVQAQITTQPVVPFCGTEDLTLEQAQSLVKQAEIARQKKLASGAAFQSITYVPIRPHIMRQSNGTGGFSIASLNQVIAMTNSYYLLNGLGIQFYFAGSSPDYIDNDNMYTAYNGQSVDANDAHNALNQYYVNQFSTSGLGGYAYYPNNDIISTRSFILTGSGEYEDDLGNRLIPHELGHNFNLIHTFGQNAGNGSLGSGITTELVTRGVGANCATDGDLICDTPADPYNMAGAYFTYPNGCPQYDPNSTARDANGMPFAPSITNIMSYYFPCTHDFTPGQYDRMQAGLALRQSHTAYTLDAPPTNVPAPSNLAANLSGTSVVLTWQDNASNEMGYFIERSTSPSEGFVAVGGVAPDITTFTDSKAVLYTQYYYRIRPSNTTTGSLSPNAAIRISPVVTGLNTTNISGSNAQLNWNSLGTGITYTVQYRAVGSSNWSTISNVPDNYTILYSLPVNTTYEWQVKATNGDTYSGPVNFTTPCPTPSLYTAYPSRVSASLSWTYGYLETYTLQWRVQNTPTWNSISAITSTYYSLTGLTASTPYEWRVQGTCPGSTTIVTDYSSPKSFTTIACPIPTLWLNNTTNSSSASVFWSTDFSETGRTFSLRYRAVGAPDWIVISDPTMREYTPYSLTGLTPNTTYEAQVESICSPTEHSGFSASLNFTPTCQPITYVYSSAKNSTASLIWNTNYPAEPGTTFELQYRLLGSTDWTTVSNITPAQNGSNTVYSLTGLPNNTTYEWRVRAFCPGNIQSTYKSGPNFTTGCFAPISPYWGFLSTTSVILLWNAFVEPNTHFDIQYRIVGAADWITLSNLSLQDVSTSFSYSLTGLTNNTTYEWQVRTVCSATDNSYFVTGQSFTTSCRIPDGLGSNPKATTAYLNWTQVSNDVHYDLRYRRIGTTDWITIDNLTTSNVTITGLLTNAGYEWQVRSRCTDGIFSDFSGLRSFGTYPCYAPGSLYTAEPTSTSIKLSWYNYSGDASTMYEVRYRVVGTTDWTVVGSINSTSVAIANLTSDVQYEWQVRTLCSATETSTFSYSSYFQTCSVIYTIKAGYWSDSSIWSCNRVPYSADVVQIKHNVIIPGNYNASALRISYDPGQQLTFSLYANLKLGQ